jgi:hypothetical protein
MIACPPFSLQPPLLFSPRVVLNGLSGLRLNAEEHGKEFKILAGGFVPAVAGTTFAEDHPTGPASAVKPAPSHHHPKDHKYKKPFITPTLPNHDHPDGHSN